MRGLREEFGARAAVVLSRSFVTSCAQILFPVEQEATWYLVMDYQVIFCLCWCNTRLCLWQQGFILCCYLIFRPSCLCIILEGSCPASQCSINLCTNNFLLRPSIQDAWASDGESDRGTGRDVMTLRDGGSRSSLEEAKTMCC